MGNQPAVELPAELGPRLRFDSDGTPLIYDLGQQLIRDRKRASEYLEGHFSGARLIRNLLLFAALIAPIGVPVIAAINGVDPGRVIISTLVGVSLLLLLGCISMFFDNGKNYDMERFGREMARRRRIEFRAWAESSMKTKLSEKDLDELQNRIGAARLEREKSKKLDGHRSALGNGSTSSAECHRRRWGAPLLDGWTAARGSEDPGSAPRHRQASDELRIEGVPHG